ncbi:MAG: hypothetical protein GTO29_13420 [Candidatus Latescibacteria bacterium]|nr:hypothetical protein [Candidatus Latescibacterota bacterium]NIO57251.1 hypothetical protein [Candidatus Latescibacterota bacterium]
MHCRYARLSLSILSTTVALIIFIGCGPRRGGFFVVNKTLDAPPPVACCSATGHNPDNIPYILGGNCFCTPSHRLIQAMHAAGYHPDIDYKSLVNMYKHAGITTDLDHRGCNNLCSNGPHVAFGGKCMATPTPGTRNYERVLSTAVAPAETSGNAKEKEGTDRK